MRKTHRARASRTAALLLAGLMGLAACSAQPDRRTIDVRMHYSRYLPASLAVRAGQTVEFIVVNDDPIAHEFIIGTEAEQQAHERGDPNDPHNGPGEARIGANETVRVSYTFDRPGRLLYACHVAGHYAYGMRGEVHVT